VPWISESKTRDAAELAISYLLILLAEWFPNSALQRFLFWFTLAWVIVTTILARPNARTLGLRPSNARSVWIVPAIVLLGALSVWMASQLHTLHGLSVGTLMGRVRGYLAWSLLQQFMLQEYFLLRLLRLMPGKAIAVSTAAILFASARIPNPVLMLATLLWGVAAYILFLRYRDLYSLGLAHCLLGICIAVTVPAHIHHGMRVGLGYLQYWPRVERYSLQPDGPDGVDGSMGDRRCRQSVFGSPGSTIENARERGQ
jgi:Type II CAAX prenyl endopeptidase Rce1-like